MKRTGWIVLSAMIALFSTQTDICPAQAAVQPEVNDPFTFIVTADQRSYSGPGVYDTSDYYRGACEAIATLGGGAFMASPGDIDPPDGVKWTMEQTIGTEYLWYPVVGNHESETPSDMDWLRTHNLNGDTLPYIVNVGPAGSEETTYSFDYENAHFVVLNQYFNGISDTGGNGDVSMPCSHGWKTISTPRTKDISSSWGMSPHTLSRMRIRVGRDT